MLDLLNNLSLPFSLWNRGENMYDPFVQLLKKIRERGGFVNAHSHLDRAYTVKAEDLNTKAKKILFDKWKLVDEFKRNATVDDYQLNIANALSQQSRYGTGVCLSFIDIDPVCEDRAMRASWNIKKDGIAENLGIVFKVASQTLKGICRKENQELLEKALENDWIDILGCLPRADGVENMEQHLDIMMRYCKETKKRLHIHCDQMNTAFEKETELVARKTMQWGVEGRVSCVHSISLACHPKSYRDKVYRMCRDSGMSFITCPTAWIDHRRTEEYTPNHNAVTPVDEMLDYGLLVAIGSDNIHDIYKPYANGDMATELRFLLESLHIYNQETLLQIATDNGRVVLDLPVYRGKKEIGLVL